MARHNSQYSAKILINYDIIYVIIYSYINNHVIRIIPTTTTTYGSQEIQYKDRRRRGQHWCKDGGLELLETASTRRNESKNNKNEDNNNIKTGASEYNIGAIGSQEIQYIDRRRRGQHWCKDGDLGLLEPASTRRKESKKNNNNNNNNNNKKSESIKGRRTAVPSYRKELIQQST